MSKSEQDKVTQEVYGLTKVEAWRWPEKARQRLSLYLASSKHRKEEREACVRSILKILREEKMA